MTPVTGMGPSCSKPGCMSPVFEAGLCSPRIGGWLACFIGNHRCSPREVAYDREAWDRIIKGLEEAA